MKIPVVHGDLWIDGIAPENVKIITGKLIFQSASASLSVNRVNSVEFKAASSGNEAFIANLNKGIATIDGFANLLEIGNFSGGFASLGGVLNTLEIGNGANAIIDVGGTDNTVEVRAGDVTYRVVGANSTVEDGDGDSVFFVEDAFDFDISDGAGDDTIIVDRGDGGITLGEGADVVWVKSGFVDIFDFVPGEDTLRFGEAGTEFPVDGSLALDFIDADGNPAGITVFVAEDGLV